MNTKIIKSLYKKEILDVLRDKKTVLMMLVVPLIVYPLLIVLTMQVMAMVSTELAESTYVVAVDSEDEEEYSTLFANDVEEGYYFSIVNVDDYAEALRNQEIDAYVTKEIENEKEVFVVHYLSATTNSNYAASMIESRLSKYSTEKTEELILEEGLDPEIILKPISVEFADMSSNEESAGNMMGNLISFMLVVSLLMGTMYPAIDTTAGERERGTLETILTLPVSNQELIMSKFLTVATIGVVSALLNVISMGGIMVYMLKMMESMGADKMNVNMMRFVPAICVCILCIFAFAIFISAITMCVCAFAKTYKEANNYITPLMLVVMFASFVGFVPNIQLTNNMALVPVANICLLIRDILVFKFDIGIITIVLISNIAYGVIAVMLLGKIYNSEAILFGDNGASVQILEKRCNMKKGGVPTIGDAWLVMAVTAVGMIYAGGLIQLEFGYYGIAGSQLMFLLIPLALVIYTKKDIKKTFKLKLCKTKYILGGIIISVGAILVGMMLSFVSSIIFESSAQSVVQSTEALMCDNIIKMLLVVAVAPAICEELLFRGFLLSSLENKLKPKNAIIIVALLFGVFHMSIVKFFTTALLGYVFAYLAHKSQSIIPGMIMHFINNGLSCIVMFYPEKVGKLFPILVATDVTAKKLVVITILGVALITVGILILEREKTKI